MQLLEARGIEVVRAEDAYRATLALSIDAHELDALCLDRIARFKRPKDYVFIDTLPKNNYGKILKTELRARDTQRVVNP